MNYHLNRANLSPGVIPIHLNELSPPAFRSSFPGITYQLGNMISSPSAQIVNAIAESHLVRGPGGALVSSYGQVMGIATAIIAIGIAVTAALGPEKRGSKFENAVIGGGEMQDVSAKVEDLERGSIDKAGTTEVVEIENTQTKAN